VSVTSVREAVTGPQELDRDTFLSLLVTQLQYQDPLEPMDHSEFISQLAQLQAVAELAELNTAAQQLVGLQQWVQTVALLGRHVTAVDPDSGETVQGLVESVDLGAGEPQIVVNGLSLGLADIRQVAA
jgi:flagellar basal-body rod modification protein FlgD